LRKWVVCYCCCYHPEDQELRYVSECLMISLFRPFVRAIIIMITNVFGGIALFFFVIDVKMIFLLWMCVGCLCGFLVVREEEENTLF